MNRSNLYNELRLALVCAGVAATLTACHSKEYRHAEGIVWRTTYSITYNADRNLDAEIAGAMTDVEMSLSPFAPNSLISCINHNEDVLVDNRLAKVFYGSRLVNDYSNGAFDPTVAPLINLWGFGYDNAESLPTQAEIDSCLNLVGIADCDIVEDRMVKKAPGTQFNFSAITKGFGCDEVGRALEAAGCSDYMVEIGGELTLKGRNPKGNLWRVMIDAPIESADEVIHEGVYIIEVTDCGIATSGNYRNYRDTEKGRVSHTISPTTGYPVRTNTLSVTVIAPNAMLADALATAAMAMPLDSAMNMIETLGPSYSALFITAPDSVLDPSSSTASSSGTTAAPSDSIQSSLICKPTANFPAAK